VNFIANNLTILTAFNTFLQKYTDWLLKILTFTGLSFGSIFLFCFIIWLMLNLLLSILAEALPFLKGLLRILEFLLLPGAIMHNVWHVFAAKRLNIPIEQAYNFGFGHSRSAIKINRPFKNLRESILFFWSPFLNLFIIIGWIVPGMFLFQWLDTLIEPTIFYWIWLYFLFSLIMFGLPDGADLVNPFTVTIVKTPEFYLFIVFYVILAPMTLVLWGYGITVLFSLVYAITAFYEIHRIAQKEEKRLGSKFDKVFKKTETKYIIIPDSEYSD